MNVVSVRGRARFAVWVVAIAVSTAGLPPCVAMESGMVDCDGVMDDAAPAAAPIAPADCCDLSTLPQPRPPVERAFDSSATLVPMVTVARVAPEVTRRPRVRPAHDPPDAPGTARHLFLSVLLI